MPLDENEEFEFRLRAEREAGMAQPAQAAPERYSAGRNIGGQYDAATSLLSGAIAAPVGGIAGLAGAALPGPQGQGADWAEKTQKAMTYEPRTQTGKDIAGVATYLPGKIAEGANVAGEKTAEVTGSPALGAGVNTGIQALPALLARALKGPVGKAVSKAKTEGAAEASRNSVKDATWEDAKKEGYVVPPSAVEGSFVSNRLESIGGKAAVGQEAAVRNQEVTNRLSRKAAGLGKDEPLTQGNLEAARARLAAPYEEVSRLSKSAGEAWDQAREERRLAQREWEHYKVTRDPTAMDRAEAHTANASFYEQWIEGEAKNVGRPELVKELRKARMDLAKNYDVEKALNLGDGNVDARLIGRMYDKRGAKAMTGELGLIGRFANAFFPYAREGGRIPTPGVSKSEALAGLGLGFGGFHAFGPFGTLAAGIPLMTHAARPLVLSKMMQPTRTYGPGLGLRATDTATRNPYAFGAIPALGLKRQEE